MRMIVTQKLTLTYLQKLSWQNYLAATFAAIVISLSVVWMTYHIGGQVVTGLFSDSIYALGSAFGVACIGLLVYRSRKGPVRLEPRLQWAWICMCLGMLMDLLGEGYYTYKEATGAINPLPSIADIAFTLTYPLLITGLVLMTSQFKRERFRFLIGLDGLITTLSLLGISWFFFIGPTYLALQSQHLSPAALIVSLLYPFLDMLLVFAIILLILRPAEYTLRTSLILIGVGYLSCTWADTGYAYFSALGSYDSGTPYIDTFWFICSFLLGIAALYQYTSIARAAYNQHTHLSSKSPEAATYTLLTEPEGELHPKRTLFIHSFLVYVPYTLVLFLTICTAAFSDLARSLFLVIISAITGILIVVRYLITNYENDILLQEREKRIKEAERLRLLTAQLTESLDLAPLLERIVALASSALAFDTATLAIEERPALANTPGNLTIYAATSAAEKILNWRIYGNRISFCTLLQGQESEVDWSEPPPHPLPSEIVAWQQKQQVKRTFFVPLRYPGNGQGLLGFSRRSAARFSDYDKYIARTFAEQAKTALEHAYLFQDARERETFAQAIANIATRLNAVTVEPSEIQQVICTESAKALRADYALLYVPDHDGMLVPVAQALNPQERATDLAEWPAIYEHEYEAQVLLSSQPVLLPLAHLYALSSSEPQPVGPTLTPHQGYGLARRHRMHKAFSLREMLAQRSVPSAILVPLFNRKQPIALLILARSLRPGTTDKQAFTTPHLSQARDFAKQAAVAYTNALLYQELSNAHQQLQELDQLKDQFMITASHELRTPLTAVQGYLELLGQYDETLPAQQRQEFIHKTRAACDELVLLLNNVMDASRLEVDAGIRPAHIESVSVEEILQSVLDLLEPQLSQEARETYLDIPPHLAVQADPVRLRQILRNLIMNALKYSPSGSPLTFLARIQHDPQPSVILSIVDKGQGIMAEDQQHLFQRFVRLERDINSPVRGSGLGLYISRRLVEAMKGSIWLESSGVPGEGTIFHIQLPIAH